MVALLGSIGADLDDTHIVGTMAGEVTHGIFEQAPAEESQAVLERRANRLPQGFIGAERATSITGELSAIAWALLWALAHAGDKEVRVYVDCMPAMNHAADVSFLSVHPVLGGLISYIASCFKPGQLQFAHVKGHNGQPWNELADFTAKSVLSGDRDSSPVPYAQVAKLVLAKGLHDWGWLSRASDTVRAQYPPMKEGAFLIGTPVTKAHLFDSVDPQPV